MTTVNEEVIAEAEWMSKKILFRMLKNGQLAPDYNHLKPTPVILTRNDVQFIGVDEAFMLTKCYRSAIDFKYGTESYVFRFVVKKCPSLPENVLKAINFQTLFRNEIIAYTIILPALTNFSRCPIATPKYYYSEIDGKMAALVLGDFSAGGTWRLSTEKVNLSLEHVKLAVGYLAHFHGLGFALREVAPQHFETISSGLREARYAHPIDHPELLARMEHSQTRLIRVINKYQPDISQDFINRVTELTGDHYNYPKQLVQPVSPMVTICHGDYLRNNIAFRFDPKKPETPLDVMIFDWQTMRVSSPMIDLSVFLALSTFAEVRHKHFDSIFDTYSTQLAETYMAHTNRILPNYLSRESLLKEYTRFLPYSIGIAAFFLMQLVEPEQITGEEFLQITRSMEEIEIDTSKRGGEVVDRELAHQVKELYDLSKKLNVDVGAALCSGKNN